MEQPYIRDDGLSPALARTLGLPLERWEIESNVELNVRRITDESADPIACASCRDGGEYCLGCASAREVSDAYFEGLKEMVRLGIFPSLQEATSMTFPDAALQTCPVDAVRYMHPTDLERLRPSPQLTRGQKVATILKRLNPI
jgi:hypothetical protein